MGGMLADGKPYTFDRVFRLFLAGVLLWGLVWLLGYLSDVLIPFAVALLLAYLLNPLVELVQRLVRVRVAAVLVSLALIVAAVGLLAWLAVPLIAAEITQMGRLMQEMATSSTLAQKAAALLPESLWSLLRDLLARPGVHKFFQSADLWSMALALARKLLPGLWGLISQVGSFILGLTGLFIVALYFFFLLLDFDKVSARWQEIIPPAQRERVVGLIQDFQSAMSRYFRAQAAVAGLVGVLFAAGFALIGLPLGIILGLFMGLLNMVPYLQLLGLIPAFLLAVLASLQSGTDLWLVLALTGGVFLVVQLIQELILTPRIMGQAMGLSPAFILLSLSVWGKLLGFLGLIIAIPLTCLLWAWYQRFVTKPGQPGQAAGT